jgi:hypothetical protein
MIKNKFKIIRNVFLSIFAMLGNQIITAQENPGPATLPITRQTGNTHADIGEIHSVAYSHGDLGYGNYPHILRTENRLENLFRAIEYCDKTEKWPNEAKYRWQQENAEPLVSFLSSCSTQQLEKLTRYVKEGRISIAATHGTVLGDRLNPESAARLFYLGGRFIPDLLGTPPAKVAIINDVTGIPWSFSVYCEAAQVPFLWNGHNSCGRMDELESAPIVQWIGPNGTGSVSVFSAIYNYGAVSNPETQIPDAIAKDAKRITPNYIPVWLQGGDFTVTTLSMATAAKQWNQTGSPKIYISTIDLYLNKLKTLQTPAKTPTVNKTGPCQWMDQPLSDAWLFGRVRQAGERLPVAEKFSAIALTTSQGGYPWLDFTIGWHNLLSNFEHTIGAACWRCNNAEGWRHYETEQVEHREEGLTAVALANCTLDKALTRLTSQIKTPYRYAIAVFNPLGQSRSDAVILHASVLSGKNVDAVDDVSGAIIPCQWLNADTLLFIAPDVPALGYRTFHLVEQSRKNQPVIENKFYKLKLDSRTGTIASLIDKELNQELVRQDAPHGFNQYLYQWFPQPTGESLWSNPAVDVKIISETGPVASIYHIRGKAEGVEWFDQTITLFHTIKRIDFAIRMNKKPSGRSLADYNANNLRGKESVFVALPLNIPGFKAVYQTAGGGVAEPIRDQFNGTGTAFYSVQHFADLSNDKFGVTVSPIDCALVEFDHPRSDALSRTRPDGEMYYEKKMEYPKNSTIYFYLLNNMFTTNIRVDQRGEHLFRWAMRSHAGNWQTGQADQFGETINQPLVARFINTKNGTLPGGTKSFASVDADNVSVSTIKLAEYNGNGFILRLNETRGRKTIVNLSVPFLGSITSANETTLTETDLNNPLQVLGNTIPVELPAYGVKTIRVRSMVAPAGKIRKISAKPISDMEVALEWDKVDGSAFYRVYRDTMPDFKPSLLKLVAMPAVNNFVDKPQNRLTGWIANRLNPGTTYYYQVEAVSQTNERGPVSACVSVKTLTTAQKACPPEKVRDLHAILVSPLAPVNQVNLLWRNNIEQNVVRYEIYRSAKPGFKPSQATLLTKEDVQFSTNATIFRGLSHQMFLDKEVGYSKTYFYKIRAITAIGQPGAFSEEVSIQTRDDDSNPTK